MYVFKPAPVFDDPLFKIGKFPAHEKSIDRIVAYGDSLETHSGYVGFEKQEIMPENRVSDVGWIHPGPRTQWIYEIVEEIIQDANGKWFHFDLAGIRDSLQYTIYDSSKGGHFDWHLDMGDKYGGPQRKLSMSLILSDPSEYEGGDFQVMEGSTPKNMPFKDKGTAIVFPSYVIHRVTPVTKGIRKALVAWACGPKFR